MTALDRICAQDWYVRPGSYIERLIVDATVRPETREPQSSGPVALRPTVDARGNAIMQASMTPSRVAVVPIVGGILKGAKGSDKAYYGLTSHEDIWEDISRARSSARAIMLYVNSPGGTVVGTHELASRIADLAASGYPIASYTEDQKCSAAEYITAGCTMSLATPSAIVGSIGTMLAMVDASKFLEKFGIQFNVFTSGKYKALGHPGKSLTPEQSEWVQGFVNERAAEFKKHMTSHRPGLEPAHMEGQIFTGAIAAEFGLIDSTVDSFEEALSLI